MCHGVVVSSMGQLATAGGDASCERVHQSVNLTKLFTWEKPNGPSLAREAGFSFPPLAIHAGSVIVTSISDQMLSGSPQGVRYNEVTRTREKDCAAIP